MTITKRLGDWILRLMFGPDPEVAPEVATRKFRKTNGTLLAGVAYVEIRVDDSGFRMVRTDGTSTPWSDNGHFTMDLARRCLDTGHWTEVE